MNLVVFFSHPAIAAIRYGQLLLAIALYCYFALSGMQSNQLTYSDSTLHFLGNIFLFMSVWLATCLIFRLHIQFLLVLPFAALIELAQILSPSRQFDMHDMLFNFLGLGVGVVLCFIVNKILLRSQF